MLHTASPSTPRAGNAAREALLARARRRLIELARVHCAGDAKAPVRACGILDSEAFQEELRVSLEERAWRRCRPMLACIELDGADPARAAQGSADAETLLRAACTRLAEALSSDDRISRHDDQLVCLVRDAGTLEHAVRIAAALYDALCLPGAPGAPGVSLLPSIGVACFPRDGVTPSTLRMRAEAALHRARHYRMGYAFYTGVLDAAFATPAGIGDWIASS